MSNPTAPEMMLMKAKSSHNVLEWILVALVILTLVGLGVLFTLIQQLNQSVSSLNADIMDIKQASSLEMEEVTELSYGEDGIDEYVLYADYAIPVWYPSTYSVSAFQDPGIDIGPIAHTKEGIQITGTEGYQMQIYEISEEEYQRWASGEPPATSTTNPLVQSVYAECVGTITEEGVEDCFFAGYLVRWFGHTYFHINARTTGSVRVAEDVTNAIIDRIGSRSTPLEYRSDVPDLPVDFDSEVITIAKEYTPFPFTSEDLANRAKGCGEVRSVESFIPLIRLFSGERAIRYDLRYFLWPGMDDSLIIQDGAFVLHALPNLPGYRTLESFKKDFQLCDAGGQLYPSFISHGYLVFVDACGTGYRDDSGRLHECEFIRDFIMDVVSSETE